MCGRYAYMYAWRQIFEQLGKFMSSLSPHLRDQDGPPPSYNVAPTDPVPVLRVNEAGLDAYMMRWWLVPSWADSAEPKFPMFNARAETAATKPAFKASLKRRRCVLPVSGFYEWRISGSKKQPFYITRADGELLYFAGLWDTWRDELDSCTVLTCEPNAEMSEVHNRMPVILEPEQIAGWVSPELQDPDSIAEYLRPAADGVLVMHKVSSRVGNSRVNDAGLIEPESPGGLFG